GGIPRREQQTRARTKRRPSPRGRDAMWQTANLSSSRHRHSGTSTLFLDATADMELGDGLASDIARDDFGVNVGLPAVAQHQSVAGLVVQDLQLLGRHLEVAVEGLVSLVVVTGKVAVDRVEDRLISFNDLTADVFQFLHRSPPGMTYGHP